MNRRWLKIIALLVLVAVLAVPISLGVAARTVDVVRYGAYPSGMGHKGGFNSHIWRSVQQDDGIAQMRRWEKVILATPRTEKFAGSIEEGKVDYVTHSKWWGFPDVIALERNVQTVETGPLTFSVGSWSLVGKLDFGVNERRIRDWLRIIEAGG